MLISQHQIHYSVPVGDPGQRRRLFELDGLSEHRMCWTGFLGSYCYYCQLQCPPAAERCVQLLRVAVHLAASCLQQQVLRG